MAYYAGWKMQLRMKLRNYNKFHILYTLHYNYDAIVIYNFEFHKTKSNKCIKIISHLATLNSMC